MSDYWDYSFFNVSVIRYADVLLLYAECLNDKGETTEAINIINKVRARVNVPALPLTMSKAEVLKHLQDKERLASWHWKVHAGMTWFAGVL